VDMAVVSWNEVYIAVVKCSEVCTAVVRWSEVYIAVVK